MIARRPFLLASALGAFTAFTTARVVRADGGAPRTLDGELARVAAARSGLRSLVGPFTQERTIGLLAAKVKSTGTLSIQVPDRLRWELHPPDAVTYWVGPEGLAYRSGRSGAHGRLPPTQAKVAAALEDLRLVLSGDLDKLGKRYELSLLPLPAGAEGFGFSAKPRPQSAGNEAKLSRIDFELDKTGAPRKVVLIEGEKDKTDIAFGNLIRDGAINPALLRPPF